MHCITASITRPVSMCIGSTEVYNTVLTVNTRMPTPILYLSSVGEYRMLPTLRGHIICPGAQ
jgi:hypothetical protein